MNWYDETIKIRDVLQSRYIDIDGEVLTNKGHKVGFVARDRDSDSVKAFRWDRVTSLIALDA